MASFRTIKALVFDYVHVPLGTPYVFNAVKCINRWTLYVFRDGGAGAKAHRVKSWSERVPERVPVTLWAHILLFASGLCHRF